MSVQRFAFLSYMNCFKFFWVYVCVWSRQNFLGSGVEIWLHIALDIKFMNSAHYIVFASHDYSRVVQLFWLDPIMLRMGTYVTVGH